MLIPIGHDRNEVRVWPLVTITIIVVCVLVHAGLAPEQAQYDRGLAMIEDEIVMELVRCPSVELEVAEALESRIARERAVAGRAAVCESPERARGRVSVLESRWRAMAGNHPTWRLGFVPSTGGLVPMVRSAFVHADWSHVLFNMLFLFLFAFPLENRWGHLPFLGFYLLAIVAEGNVVVRYTEFPSYPHLGASGAISAAMGAYLVLFASSKVRLLLLSWPVFGFVLRVPAWLIMAFWVAKDALAAWGEHITGESTGVAHWAHLGGMGFGVLFALALVRTGADRQLRWRFGDDVDSAELAPIERALFHEQLGHRQVAWQLLRDALERRPKNLDYALALWRLEKGRPRQVQAAALALPAIESELESGDAVSAIELLAEIQSSLGQRLPASPARLGRLVRALVPHRAWEVVEPLLQAALERAGEMPLPLMTRLAGVATAFDCGLAAKLARVALEHSPSPAPYLRARLERCAPSSFLLVSHECPQEVPMPANDVPFPSPSTHLEQEAC